MCSYWIILYKIDIVIYTQGNSKMFVNEEKLKQAHEYKQKLCRKIG